MSCGIICDCNEIRTLSGYHNVIWQNPGTNYRLTYTRGLMESNMCVVRLAKYAVSQVKISLYKTNKVLAISNLPIFLLFRPNEVVKDGCKCSFCGELQITMNYFILDHCTLQWRIIIQAFSSEIHKFRIFKQNHIEIR